MKLLNLLYIALFAAIVGVMGFFPPIPLPISPVPVTLSTLGVMLAGSILGAKRGGLSLLLFLLLVAIGAPLLSGGRGGIAPLIGPSGGYVLAWPVASFVIGYLTEKTWRSLTFPKLLTFNIIGAMLIDYLCGVSYLSIVGDLPWGPTALTALAFVPGDLLKAIIASYVALKISKVYPLIKPKKRTSPKLAKGVS